MVNYDLGVPALRAHTGAASTKFEHLTWETSVQKVKAALFVQIREEGRRRFRLEHPDIDLFKDAFPDFLQQMYVLFDVVPDPRSERFDTFSRKHKPTEILEQHWYALAEIGKKCKFGNLEKELLRDIFIANIIDKDVQRKLTTQSKSPAEVLQYIKD